MKREIKSIRIDQIASFPEQREVYGVEELEPEFVASIADIGIKNPVTVAEQSCLANSDPLNSGYSLECLRNEKKYICISGHRRIQAAEKIGMKTVPVIVENFKNYEEASLTFLILNQQREKTLMQRRQEFLRAKQILRQVGKLRKKSGSYEGTAFENEEFSRILETYNVGEDKHLDSVTILKDCTGFNKYQQEMNTVIFDDEYRDNQIRQLQKEGLVDDAAAEVEELWAGVRKKVNDGELSLNDAANSLRSMVREAMAKLKPTIKKAKKKKAAKPAKPKTKPKPTGDFPILQPLQLGNGVEIVEPIHSIVPNLLVAYYKIGPEINGVAVSLDGANWKEINSNAIKEALKNG